MKLGEERQADVCELGGGELAEATHIIVPCAMEGSHEEKWLNGPYDRGEHELLHVLYFIFAM